VTHEAARPAPLSIVHGRQEGKSGGAKKPGLPPAAFRPAGLDRPQPKVSCRRGRTVLAARHGFEPGGAFATRQPIVVAGLAERGEAGGRVESQEEKRGQRCGGGIAAALRPSCGRQSEIRPGPPAALRIAAQDPGLPQR